LADDTQSLFGVLEQRFNLRIGSGRRTFSAESANEEVAERLGLNVGAPVQYLEQVTYLNDRRPVEYSDVWINSRLLRVTSLLPADD
jgi:DNA-binding GntR family transcriptional regulator